MAFSKLYVCDACGVDRVLSHAQEWTPGPDGPVPYPGTGPVGGLLNRLWCPTCREVRLHPFVILSPPADHAVVAYAEAQRLGCDGTEVGPCPVCRESLTWAIEGEPCPACRTGRFRFTGEWEDAV
jgi:hypothetical protein